MLGTWVFPKDHNCDTTRQLSGIHVPLLYFTSMHACLCHAAITQHLHKLRGLTPTSYIDTTRQNQVFNVQGLPALVDLRPHWNNNTFSLEKTTTASRGTVPSSPLDKQPPCPNNTSHSVMFLYVRVAQYFQQIHSVRFCTLSLYSFVHCSNVRISAWCSLSSLSAQHKDYVQGMYPHLLVCQFCQLPRHLLVCVCGCVCTKAST
jgi:hypothetical protein